jgi:hypothetical protein
VAKEKLLLEEVVGCGVEVVELQDPVPQAYRGGWWYAAGSPYPPGKADAPPTTAMKAKVRSIMRFSIVGP